MISIDSKYWSLNINKSHSLLTGTRAFWRIGRLNFLTENMWENLSTAYCERRKNKQTNVLKRHRSHLEYLLLSNFRTTWTSKKYFSGLKYNKFMKSIIIFKKIKCKTNKQWQQIHATIRNNPHSLWKLIKRRIYTLILTFL